MGIYRVEVAVSVDRPPKTDHWLFFEIEADSGVEAELTACMMAQAHPRVVMPVASVVTDWPEECV